MASPNRRRQLERDSMSEDEDLEPRRPTKRARVALACQRCRARKQKCDGALNSCSTCTRLGVHCHYKAHLTPKPDQRKLYIAALEDRVAELETMISGMGNDKISNDHWKRTKSHFMDTEQDENINTFLGALRDLVSSASGNEVQGRKSSITLGRVLGSVINSQKAPKTELHREDDHQAKTISRSELIKMMGPMFVSPIVATRLLDGWVKHLATRHPVIHTPRLRELHARRNEVLDIYEESILHLVYANSGRYLETTGETGNFFTEQHYEAALQNLDAVLDLRDFRSVAYLFLLALYCLRAPRDPGAWTLAGLAVRLCIELSMHRRKGSGEVSLQDQIDKRIFWTCYCLDRELSVALARPPAIADNDIDVEFPLDVNEDVDDLELLQQAADKQSDHPASPPTSLTLFIHFLRLKLIEGKIEFTIYRVDNQKLNTPSVIKGFLDQLSAWERAIPSEYNDKEDVRNEPFHGIDIFMIVYHKCVRLLLYPQLSESPLNLHYVKLCANACAGVCEVYKRLHRKMKAGYSPLSLQTVFLAGLTLLYCTWLAPQTLPDITGPISDCNVMLYVMTERWPAGHTYRDVFERIKVSVTDAIAKGNHKAARVSGVGDDITERCKGLSEGFSGGAKNDITRMITDMTGQNVTIGTGVSPVVEGDTIEVYDGSGNFTDPNFLSSLEGFEALSTGWDLAMFNSTTLDFGDGVVDTVEEDEIDL